MIPLLLLIVAVLVALAWRFPHHRAWVGAALVAVILIGWLWFEFGPARDERRDAVLATGLLSFEDIAFEPWSGEHRLRGTATNRSADLVLTGFDARLHLRDCENGDCRALGVHEQRINLRVLPEESLQFERRIRLAPGIATAIRGTVEVDIEVVEIHGRRDLHRAGGASTRAD